MEMLSSVSSGNVTRDTESALGAGRADFSYLFTVASEQFLG